MSGESVSISKEQFRSTYEQGFHLWAKIHASIAQSTGPPFVDLRYAFQAQPSFSPKLSLVREKIANENRICVYGHSIWNTVPFGCSHRPASFQQSVRVDVASKKPCTLIAETSSAGLYSEWYPCNGNFIAVLALAWSYVLSARWAEVLPAPCVVEYGEARADIATKRVSAGPDTIIVDIGDAGVEEARWWSAILADGHGWQATMSFDGETFLAPWSAQLECGHRFILAADHAFSPCQSPLAPSYLDAKRFIEKFCLRHGIADQSHAALAAVLLLPTCRSRKLRVPVSLADDSNLSTRTAAKDVHSSGLRWDIDDDTLDRLLMLSCYTKGVRPMLLGIFYEPGIYCNIVSAWLQGELAAIDQFSQQKPLVLGRMLMERSPKVSFLWLGATILGLNDGFLKEAHRGQIPIDLTSAAWSDTIQTFLQLPTFNPLGATVTRADECRLLFLCQSDDHRRLPIVQWEPFGATDIDDVDVEVRNHAKCTAHRLFYQNYVWVKQDNKFEKRSQASILPYLWNRVQRGSFSSLTHYEEDKSDAAFINNISYEGMDPKKDAVSRNATRNIFSWLRINGWARHERDITKHAWFADLDSEEEMEESGPPDEDRLTNTEFWISKLPSF